MEGLGNGDFCVMFDEFVLLDGDFRVSNTFEFLF